MTQVMSSLGFHPSAADPCLFVKNPEKSEPPAFVMLYVDDGGIIGTLAVIKKVLETIKRVPGKGTRSIEKLCWLPYY